MFVFVVQLLSHVWLFVTPWLHAVSQVYLSFINSLSLLKLISIESMMPSNHLILLLPPFPLASIFPRIRVFSNKLTLHIRWPKYWGFSFNMCPSDEYSGLMSFSIDWFDLLAVQGTLLRVFLAPQFKSICSSALSLLYCPTLTSIQAYWKNHSFDYTDLCQQSDVTAFNYAVCHRFAIHFLPRSRCLLISPPNPYVEVLTITVAVFREGALRK